MSQTDFDPRIVRTRQLITDAFIELSSQKEFKQITIKDITTNANINRATFYYHFKDIYDLLETVLADVLMINLKQEAYQKEELDEEEMVQLFIAITNFQRSLSQRCHRGYEETIARIIKDQLSVIFIKKLTIQYPNEPESTIHSMATMLSWGLYGASVEWRNGNQTLSPEEYIRKSVSYLLYGFGIDK
ncbi:TetR/AcrR family transcriptional regulator [Gracilibacillus kekensis]|uniref:Transcriptional regulator, TetR family n=1 Tax=Gracilibacillus kekensis TaxID=1027249 RepID=A0A1M7L841_9BACI|nr:TetR/AcrR family transcriptional regulator [Gracilibacillus kekensis]SHM74190.1 transcriptional regulator, TetR family [Gracilibacillus kekensis]